MIVGKFILLLPVIKVGNHIYLTHFSCISQQNLVIKNNMKFPFDNINTVTTDNNKKVFEIMFSDFVRKEIIEFCKKDEYKTMPLLSCALAILLCNYCDTNLIEIELCLNNNEMHPIEIKLAPNELVMDVVNRITNKIKTLRIDNIEFKLRWGSSINYIDTFQNDISIEINYRNDNFYANCTFNYDVIKTKKIRRLLKHLINVVEQLLKKNEKVATIRLITEKEEFNIKNNFINQVKIKATNISIWNKFRIIAKRNYDRPALIYKDEILTYKDVHSLSLKITQILLDKNIKQGDVVLLYLEQIDIQILSILALFYLHCTFVPISITASSIYVSDIIKSANPQAILVDKSCEINFGNLIVINLDKPSIEKCPYIDAENSFIHNAIAYIIFTSGTTGAPKGIKISQLSIMVLPNVRTEKRVS